MRRHFIKIMLVSALVATLTSCDKEERCSYTIGITDFSIYPNTAGWQGLNTVGGYMYLHGGYRGVLVVRLAASEFVAFERACPLDDGAVEVVDWGADVLVCPKCHQAYLTATGGMPMDGDATSCPLYQYSTSYVGGVLYVY